MPKRKISRVWITPTIIGGIATAAIVISGLHGLWREWWVEWFLIPLTIGACSFGIYEFSAYKKNIPRVRSRLIASASFLLIVCIVIFAYNRTAPLAWQPPELPLGCKTAYLLIGDATFPINIEEIKNGHPFVPSWGRLDDERMKSFIKTFPSVVLKHNRLYVKSRTTYGIEVFSDPSAFDDKLNVNCDRNTNANAFELVNESLEPTLQVIYERPNAIRVNGVFRLTKNGQKSDFIWAIFGMHHGIYEIKDDSEKRLVLEPYKTNILFRYPSWKYPGVLADVSPSSVNSAKIAWLPPEIPDGYKTATFSIAELSWQINLDDLKNEKPFFPPEMNNMVSIRLNNNRLYVQADVGCFYRGTNSGSTELIDGPRLYDDVVNKTWAVNKAWDRNFSPTVFEVVNEDTNPVFQVIYNRPNRVSLNWVLFGVQPDFKPMILPGGIKVGPAMIMFCFGTNVECSFLDDPKKIDEVVRSGLMRYKSFRQFKYPSYNHLGQYVDQK